jgi:hypothetical protein
MITKHTPGPWSVHETTHQMNFEDTTICRIKFSGQDTDLFIGSPVTNHGDALATAKLIAAAPDLLDAAKEALRLLNALEAGDGSLYPESRKQLIAAINKATL